MSGYPRGSQDEAIQILVKNKATGSYELASERVEKLLRNDKVKDKKVCVISVAGAFRKGKSFLLNFFVKYLEAAVSISTLKNPVFVFLLASETKLFEVSNKL